MRIHQFLLISLSTLLLISCGGNEKENDETTTENPTEENSFWTADLKEMDETEYPNDPDLPLYHSDHVGSSYRDISFSRNEDKTFNICMNPDEGQDTVWLNHIDIMEWIPTISDQASKDEYITKIALINQEWNRHQVRFSENEFSVAGNNAHGIVRVDLARNCLNSYLWEVIMYANEGEEAKPYYHGWFDFPNDLYADLFEERNEVSFEEYKDPMEEWIAPENKSVHLDILREFETEEVVEFENHNNEEYPLQGERKKKYVNILHPKNTQVMQDFLNDSTQFATFSQPGFYNQADPRKTELSRLASLDKMIYRQLPNGTFELEAQFNTEDMDKATNFIISGITHEDIPTLSQDDANDGWKNSMGFGNHSFYESYEHVLTHSSKTSEYFAILTDADYNWLDSHEIGIDGPLFHWDENNPNKLHFWILAFERHAFVGHYVVNIPDIQL